MNKICGPPESSIEVLLMIRLYRFASLLILVQTSLVLYGQERNLSAAENRELLNELQLIKKELGEIRTLLSSPSLTPRDIDHPTRTKPLSKEIVLPFIPREHRGNSAQHKVVVEFVDFQCPFCSYFHNASYSAFKKSFVDTGKVQFMSAAFPLDSHPDAMRMSLASVCAGNQNKYWDMQSSLMGIPSSKPEIIDHLISQLGLNATLFNNCMSNQETAISLQRQIKQAQDAGVSGTPTFLIGLIEENHIRGHLLMGALNSEEFDEAVEGTLALYKGGDRATENSSHAPETDH